MSSCVLINDIVAHSNETNKSTLLYNNNKNIIEKHPSTDIPESENNLADMYTFGKGCFLSGKNYENVPKAINNTELYENAENNRLNTGSVRIHTAGNLLKSTV